MSLDTRGIDPQRLLPQSLEDRLLGWLGRCGGIALFGVLGILWGCLLSWSMADPSLTHATTAPTRNLFGPLGAILSDLILQTLGLAAIIGLLAPMFWSIELVRRERLEGGRAKFGFYPLSLLALAGGLSAMPTFTSWPLHHGLGGVLGDGLFNLVSNLFALINADRAALASGIVLNGGAITMIGKSIGLDFAGVIAAIVPAGSDAGAIQNSITDIFGEHATRLTKRRWGGGRGNASAEQTAGPYGAASELAVPSDGYPLAGPSQWGPAQQPSYQQGAWPSDNGNYQAYANASAHNYGGAHAAPAAAVAAQRMPASLSIDPFQSQFGPNPEPGDFDSDASRASAPVVRGAVFDQSTDAASRAMAARFAPHGNDRPAVTTPPAKSPSRPNKVAGLLGGLPFLKSEPEWKRPSLNFLKRPAAAKPGPEFTQTVMRGNARLLEDVLADFGVKGEVKDIKPGPVVTLYELEPARGTKSSRVIGLADDIARSMSVVSVRAAVVPGRNAIGLELPNIRREPVLLREIFESEAYKTSDALLPLALGKSIGGEPVVADLARMPHLLVAGTTGSGKSVGINAMVLSLLFRHSPADCRLLMIDPKLLELSVYNGIPHLLTPVVTDPAKAVIALNWAVSEMEERYKRMATLSVRNIEVFNNRVRNAKKRGELLSRTVQTGFDKSGQAVFENQKMELEAMPHIVIVVDEFADLMIVAGKDVESALQRLAQMARAAGIHLILATQRPSVDIITGTIKANFPTRISFKVTSKIDSRTILNEQGAEQLLGQGDMLYSTGAGQIIRVHGAYVADEEVEAIADALRRQGTPQYIEGLLDSPQVSEIASGERVATEDDIYDRAVAIVLRDRKASTSYVQRRLSIGYNRAADLIERMERDGVITPANNVGKRDILSPGSNVDAA